MCGLGDQLAGIAGERRHRLGPVNVTAARPLIVRWINCRALSESTDGIRVNYDSSGCKQTIESNSRDRIFPNFLLERRKRAGRAPTQRWRSAICWVSTWRMDKLLQTLGITLL